MNFDNNINNNNNNNNSSNLSFQQPLIYRIPNNQLQQQQQQQNQQQHQMQNMSHFNSIDENESIYQNNKHDLNILNTDLTLKQQAMLNQFISIAGCSYDQAKTLLTSSNWQYQSALSVFFDEFSPTPYQQFHSLGRPLIPLNNNNNNNNISFTNNGVNSLSICAPSNTPVTPPNLEYLEKAFSKLNPTFNSLTSSTSSSTSSPLPNFNS